MADKKGSALPTTTTTTGIYIPILLPDGSSPTGFEDYRILLSTAQAPLVASISLNTEDIIELDDKIELLKEINSRTKYQSKVSDFQFTQAADSDVWKICARATNSTATTIKIGTTSGGDEILTTTSLNTGTNDKLELIQTNYTRTQRTLYFTISGTIDVAIYSALDEF